MVLEMQPRADSVTGTLQTAAAAPAGTSAVHESCVLRKRKTAAAHPDAAGIQLSSSSLMDGFMPPAVRQGSKKKSGRRLYQMDYLSAGFRQKLGVLNPLLLMDMIFPMLHPASTARVTWDIVMLVVVLYVAVVAPLRIAFWQANGVMALHVLEIVMTAFLSLDVIVNFRTAYITSRGELVRDSRLVAIRYIRGMFVFDVAAAIPFSLILGNNNSMAKWLALLKLIPLVRLVRLMKASGNLGSVLAMSRLLIFMLLVAHWAACFWHYLSEAIPEWPWMFSVECPTCSAPRHYLLGFYSSFLLLLGDRPDANNNLERFVVTALLFMGTLLYAVVVGSMSLLVASMWAMASRHKQRAAMVDDALRYRGVSREVRAQVGEYFDYLARFQHPGSDGVSFLQELPVGLYNTVTGSMFGPRLAQVQLFAHCERPFLWRLAQRLRLSLFMPGDTIYDVGSVGHDMYIIWKGAVVLMGTGKCIAALLCDGDHFGELGLMTASTPRPHRATALKPSDVLLLSRWDLQDAMKDFPESANVVKYRSRTRLEDHEAPSGNLWAFLAGWEQLLDEPDDAGILDGYDTYGGAAGGGLGARRSTDGDVYVQSRAVMRRRERQVAEAAAAIAAAAAASAGTDGNRHHNQQQQQQQILICSNEDGCNGGAGPVAEAREGSGQGSSSPASGPPAHGLRGFGARLANMLRRNAGGTARGNGNTRAETRASAASAALTFAVQDEEDAMSVLAASSGLSLRAPSSAALQALMRQGQTQTAAQRRGLASPPPQGRQSLSSSGHVSQRPTQEGGTVGGAAGVAALRSARAWGSQDGAYGNGVRPTGTLAGRASREVAAGAAAVPVPGRRLSRQISSRTHTNAGLWLESVAVQEFSDDEEDDTAERSAVIAWRSPKQQQLRKSLEGFSAMRKSLEGFSAMQAGGKLQHRHSRQLMQPLLAKRLGGQTHHPPPPALPPLPPAFGALALLPAAGTSRLGGGSGGGASGQAAAGAQELPHQVTLQLPVPGNGGGAAAEGPVAVAAGDASNRGGLAAQHSQELPPLPTLEEVWKQIQHAAESAGPDPGQSQAMPTPFRRLYQQSLPLTSSPPPPALRTLHPTGSRANALAASSSLYGTPYVPYVATALVSQSSGPYSGNAGGVAGAAAMATAASGSPPPHVLGAQLLSRWESVGNAMRQGSTGSSIPRLNSQGIDITADGLDNVLPPASSLPLTARPSLGTFSSLRPPGMPSPPPSQSPQISLTGLPPPPSSAAAGRPYTGAQLVGSVSPAPMPGVRAVVPGQNYGAHGRTSNHNSARPPRSSTGYTATSGGPSAGRPTGDGLTRTIGGGIASSEDGDDWSSDSSGDGNRRLIATLRSQLGQANSRALILEAQITDLTRDPLKLPLVAAAVQREVNAAVARVVAAVDTKLSGMTDLLAQTAARAEELSRSVIAADDRLQRLEAERAAGDTVGPAGADTVIPAAAAAAGGGGSGGKLLAGLVAAGLAPSMPSMEAIALARMSERRRSCNGSMSGSPAQLGNLKLSDSRLPQHPPLDRESSRDWQRSMTGGGTSTVAAGLGAGGTVGGGDHGGGGGSGGSITRRVTGFRGGPTSPAVPAHGILKSGNHNRAHYASAPQHSFTADPLASSRGPLQPGAQSLLPSLNGIIAAATAAAAADKDVSVRRGSRFFSGAPLSSSVAGTPPPAS